MSNIRQSPATIHVLTGPTAVGKTALALQWALEHDAEIISCDSLLFYRGMNIGTAKPSVEERQRVPHHMIDIAPVDQRYSVKAYLEAAVSTVDSIVARGKQVLVVGGSGFYLKAFFAPVVDAFEAQPHIVDKVAAIAENKGLVELLRQLEALNPEGLGELDVHNPRRVIKALERCLTSGRTLRALQAEFEQQVSPFAHFAKRVCLLERSPEQLWRRICLRVDVMFTSGLLEEVKGLLAAGLKQNSSAAAAIGYRETIAYIQEGQTDLNALKERIAINTRRLVAKQRKWFRNHLQVEQHCDLDQEPYPILFR